MSSGELAVARPGGTPCPRTAPRVRTHGSGSPVRERMCSVSCSIKASGSVGAQLPHAYRDTPADTQVPYLKTVLTFLGMTDVSFVYAEGLSMGADAEAGALASAHEQIEEAVAA
jgi:hypothetical protein